MNAIEYGSASKIFLLFMKQGARGYLVFEDWSYHGGLDAL